MSCAPVSADRIAHGQTETPLQKPVYQIEPQYALTVDNWIAEFASNKDNPTKIAFNVGDASNSSWDELGLDDDVEVTGSYCTFFSATIIDNNQTVTRTVSGDEAGEDLEITLTATSLGTFQIQPGNGKWLMINTVLDNRLIRTRDLTKLAGMPIVSNADEDPRDPKAKVKTAVLAYGVGMQVNLSSSAYDTINNYLEQAREMGGSASTFGFNIGLGGSNNSKQTSTATFDDVKNVNSGTTITIPTSENSYPTLLAVVGGSILLPGN